MNAPPHSILFSRPPLDIKLAGPVLDAASFEAGRRDAERALREELMQQRADLGAIQAGVLQGLRDAVPQVVRDTERALVQLALRAAERLVAGLPISQEMIEAVVREAAVNVERGAEMDVFLHPEDIELLRKTNSPLMSSGPDAERVRVQVASDVSRGGCRVQTRFGIVDAQRETKIALLERSLAP